MEYVAALFKKPGVLNWMVYVEPSGRVVKIPLTEKHAQTLAETLNIRVEPSFRA